MIIILLLMISIWIYRDSFRDILEGITQVSPTELVNSSLFAVLFFVLEGMIIYSLSVTAVSDYRIKYGISIAYCCEFYRLITFGSGTGIAEIHYLHKKGVEPAIGTGISILQFIMKKVGVAILGIISFLLLYCFPDTKELCREYIVFLAIGCIITAAIVLFLLAVTLSNNVMTFVLWLADKFTAKFPAASKKAASLKDQVRLLNESGHILLRQKRTLIQVIILNLCKLTAVYCIPAYLLQDKCSLGFIECTALMAVVYMLAGVIPAPSGIGSLEFVYLLFFGTFADPEITVPSLLVFRFVTWILPSLAGGLLCLYEKQ